MTSLSLRSGFRLQSRMPTLMNKLLIAYLFLHGDGWTAIAFSFERTTRLRASPHHETCVNLGVSHPTVPRCSSCRYRHHQLLSTRRDLFEVGILTTAAAAAAAAATISPAKAVAPPSPSSSTTIFTDKNLSVEDAKKRFQDARKDLTYLLDNYSEIAKNGGGDAVRSYLGTQGVSSHLYGIQKVLKRLTDESEDIVEYGEAMEEFNAYYYQAEGAAYQSMFAEHSSAKASPESCLATAKQDIVQMAKYMDQLAVQLNL